MRRTLATAVVLTVTFSAPTAFAADTTAPTPPGAEAAASAVIQAPAPPLTFPNITWGSAPLETSRPAALTALYASYAALQAYDVYSTRQALALGAREANPLMQGVVGNPGAFIAVKTGVGVATIVAAERLWRTNKMAAIAVMAAGNGVAAFVAARNARTLSQLR